MASLTARGRAAVVVAFLASAALAAGSLVVLVEVSKRDAPPVKALPSLAPTLLLPSGTPTPTPASTATATPTKGATPAPAATATPKATPKAVASATASRAPRQPSTGDDGPYLVASASVDPASGGTTEDSYVLTINVTDGRGTIVLDELTWGDGSGFGPSRGTACAAAAGGDCRTFRLTHSYTTPGTKRIVIRISSETGNINTEESVTLELAIEVKSASTPAPTS